MTILFDRVLHAKATLKPVQSEYCVVYEDDYCPLDTDKVTIADPWFMAMAKSGGYLPIIDAYMIDNEMIRGWLDDGNSMRKFSWDGIGGACHPGAPTQPAMSEIEAIEYLIKKDIPKYVWSSKQGQNRPQHVISKVSKIPSNRLHRNAWKFDYNPDEPIKIDFQKAKHLQNENTIRLLIARDERMKQIIPYIRHSDSIRKEYESLSSVDASKALDKIDKCKTVSDLDLVAHGMVTLGNVLQPIRE